MSKLKAMAAAGDPWAIATLARAQALGRQAGLRGAAMQRSQAGVGKRLRARKNSPFAQAMRDARDIREWTHGPRVAEWRVYELAKVLVGQEGLYDGDLPPWDESLAT